MRKITTEEFIKKGRLKHMNKYDYSLVNYVNSKSTIKIICPIHGNFEQRPNDHLNGCGCYYCGVELRSEKTKMTREGFIEKAKIIHNDKYDYSLVNYLKSHVKVKIICHIHGIFELKPNDHLTGGGCGRCVGRGKTTEDFINEAIVKYGNLYSYDLTKYESTYKKLIITCKVHGNFNQSPNHHLHGGGCPICRSSIGEREIRKLLIENKFYFLLEKRFKDCRNKNPLPFDFYLPDHNTCIEFQGEQHFRPINYFGGIKKFNELQKRDEIKRNYCYEKNIKLILIKYNETIIDKLKKANVC